MKNNFLSLIAGLISLTLLSACFLVSCNNKNKSESGQSVETDSGNSETGTYDASDMLNPFETESEGSSGGQALEGGGDSDSESNTFSESDSKNSEGDNNESDQASPSLRFISYGNGTCTVSGIGTYEDVYVIIPERSPEGDIVTSIEDKAFYDNPNIKAVQIPSTVSTIGDRAFAGCSSLVYISVDKNNKMFSDSEGVLYSKDGSRLIAFPAANAAQEIDISIRVKEICNMAFYECDNLQRINYGGTFEDWNKISIGDLNYGLLSAAISCIQSK